MKSTYFIVSLCFFIIVHRVPGERVLATVKQGTLSGQMVKTITGEYYFSFKGIPYAKPPIGKLRFKAPQPPNGWKGIRDATKHGAVCPQVDSLVNKYIPGSEDCLFLNVYTPNVSPRRLRSVIITIVGGAYKFGSGNDDIYGPDFLVSKDMVVVTFNYRLDSLGFLCMNTCEVPGNAGLKDQVAALRWVKNNIDRFGGDPNKVTIIGESAGAASVTYHLVSPMSRGLFHRAIVMSGSAPCDWNTSFKPGRRAFILGKTLGLETDNKAELLSFLQKVPYEKLINTTCEVMASEIKTNVLFKMIPFPPVIEKQCPNDSFLTRDAMELLDFGEINEVDILFSYNSQEALLALTLYENYLLKQYNRYPEIFVPSEILNHCSPGRILRLADRIKEYFLGNKTVSLKNMVEFINYANSISFMHCTQKFFKRWPSIANRYFFKFSSYSRRNYYGQEGARYGIIGASHLDDLFYIYDPKSLNLPLNRTEYNMIQQITTIIENFVKTGHPVNPYDPLVDWPQFNRAALVGVELTDTMKLIYNPDEEVYNFWEKIYREAEFFCR